MPEADLIVRNIASLATLAGDVPRTRESMRDLKIIEDAALASHAGVLVYIGSDAGVQRAVTPTEQARIIEARGRAVVPGFVDPHTHLIFAGARDAELRRRLGGASYKEIAESGGGIVRNVSATRTATTEELTAGALARLDEMLLQGTTTAEAKSGYGLEIEAELRSLQAIREADARHPISLAPTFLGAHEVPLDHRDDRDRYIEIVVKEMIPEVARRGLAVFCDVFCEAGVFTIDESRRILSAGADAGMILRLHADELEWTGGAEWSAELGARSADHLGYVSEAGMRAIAESDCVATVLPAASFYLRLAHFAPARSLIDSGAALAIATDVNPGGGLSPSMPFAMTVGSFSMGLSLEEALTAATINAAYSLDLAGPRRQPRARQASRLRGASVGTFARPSAGGRRRRGLGDQGRSGRRRRRATRLLDRIRNREFVILREIRWDAGVKEPAG